MRYSKFRISVIFRIIIIGFLASTAAYIALYTYFWLVSFWVLLLVAILGLEMFRYIEKRYREFDYFMLCLSQDDFSDAFKTASTNKDLEKAYNLVKSKIVDLRSDKEENYQYLQTVVEHMNVAIVCFEIDGKINLINKAAKDLFRMPGLSHISQFKYLNDQFYSKLFSLNTGDKFLEKIEIEDISYALSVHQTELVLHNNRYRIVSFHDIRNELDTREVESWQKLIRVITHEIMNSAIPISNLTSILSQIILDKSESSSNEIKLEGEELDDFKGCLSTIENRSKALVNFTKATKSFSHIPKPVIRRIDIDILFNRLKTLMKLQLSALDIELLFKNEECIKEIKADLELLEQVLINLILNAKEALNDIEKPFIEVEVLKEKSNFIIKVSDNGAGMDAKTMEDIFVPFFTTKEKGSGIGLSLSMQILKLHGGDIQVMSLTGKGSEFVLFFPTEA